MYRLDTINLSIFSGSTHQQGNNLDPPSENTLPMYPIRKYIKILPGIKKT